MFSDIDSFFFFFFRSAKYQYELFAPSYGPPGAALKIGSSLRSFGPFVWKCRCRDTTGCRDVMLLMLRDISDIGDTAVVGTLRKWCM